MLDLVIAGRTQAVQWLSSTTRKQQLRYVISIGAQEGHRKHPNRGCPYGFSDYRGPKIRLEFDDINTPAERDSMGNVTHQGPTLQDMRALIEFARGVDLDQEGVLLVHCYVGRCRSTAAAYILYATLWGEGRAADAIQHVYMQQAKHQRYGFPAPNSRMISLASDLLGWDLWPAYSDFDDEWYYTDVWDEYKAKYARGLSKNLKPRPPVSSRDQRKLRRKQDTRKRL